MIGVLIRGVVRLVTKPQADKLISRGVAQKIPTRGQATAQNVGKKVTTKEYNKLAKIKPKVVKPKPKTPQYTIRAKNIKTTGGGGRSPAGNVKVTTGGAKSKLPVVSGRRAVTTTGTGKPLPLSLKGKPKGKLRKLASKQAIVPLAATMLGISTLGKKPKSDQTAQATTTTTKKPKPSGMAGGPPQRKPTYNKKPPKADYPGAGLTTTEDEADRPNVAKPKTLEQKLKAKWVKSRGGEEAFGKKGSEGAWKTHVLNMREGSEAGLTYTDQQNYDKIIAERKELAAASKGATKKKRGGLIKRNKGGPVRGVGKALRGYGNNSIYSHKMY
jgi:hypothetical protein